MKGIIIHFPILFVRLEAEEEGPRSPERRGPRWMALKMKILCPPLPPFFACSAAVSLYVWESRGGGAFSGICLRSFGGKKEGEGGIFPVD